MRQLTVGNRRRERPRTRWKDCVKRDLEVMGLKEEDAMDWARRRRAIRTGDPT